MQSKDYGILHYLLTNEQTCILELVLNPQAEDMKNLFIRQNYLLWWEFVPVEFELL